MTEKQVSIIIVNYNTKELTKKAIQAVFDKTEGVEYEIIVVDNDSKDGSAEELKKTFQDKITIIEPKENLGFGRANNLGMKQAQGKYIFLLNSDTELINNAIKIFYDYMEQNEQVGVCGGNLYNINYVPEESYVMYTDNIISYFVYTYIAIFYHYFYKLTKKRKNYVNFNYSGKIKQVGYISGADMFIRQTALEKAGLFDENIFMYFEDGDLNFRIRNCGYSIMSVPQAKIFHYLSKSSTDEKQKFKIAMNGAYYFYFKYFKWKTYFIYLHMNITLIRVAITSLIILFNKNKFQLFVDFIRINKETYLEQKKIYCNRKLEI